MIVVRDSVKGRAPMNPQHFESSHIYCTEQVLCAACMWEVMCGGHSEAVQGVHGLRLASVVLLWGPWGETGSQAAYWVRHCRVVFGCRLCVCECGGMCCRGVGEGSPVLFGRSRQLFGVGGRSRPAYRS